MKKIAVLAGLLLVMLLMSFGRRHTSGIAVPKGWPEPAYNFRKHPLNKNKIELGRRLFYDPVLSRDSSISCASCHLQATAFTHTDHNVSHGIEGRKGSRNSPVLANLAWMNNLMWDGGVDAIDVQATSPITNVLEMDESIEHVLEKLNRSAMYKQMFYKAFGDSAIVAQQLNAAIAQFMLTLVSANARYDRVQRGEDTFTVKEANGYRLFRQHCAACHVEPLFTNNGFENNGLRVDPELADAGRMKHTHNPADSLKFKVPTLRNIEYSAPYMHDGRFKTLNQVLNNYIMGIQQSATLSPALKKGIYLTANEKVDMIAFLLTLTDREFLTNPAYGFLSK